MPAGLAEAAALAQAIPSRQSNFFGVATILRLDLSVQIYLLTWWRVAAFIWMVLVAQGLVLIVTRIGMNRSTDWLIRANLVTLTTTLYVCALVNFAAIIADYNVSRSREAAGKGVWIDMNYPLSLGPRALPAIDRGIALRGFDPTLVSRRGCLVEQHLKATASWRIWSFRGWRLQRDLDAQPNSTTAGQFDRGPIAPGETFDAPHSDR